MRMRTALLSAALVAGMATTAAGQETGRGPRWDRIEDRRDRGDLWDRREDRRDHCEDRWDRREDRRDRRH